MSREKKRQRDRKNPEWVERNRRNSRLASRRKRKDPEFREKENEKNRNYRKEMRSIDEELGRCTLCHKDKVPDKHKTCKTCREKHKFYMFERRRKENGV